ncbi:MAG: hypothetical protein ACOYXN_00745 [Acidobacteriota bacterium]
MSPKTIRTFSALLLTLWAVLSTPAQAPSSIQEAVLLERAALAASKRFYLELDLSRREVRLCHTGAMIAAYPARTLEVGSPRRFLLDRESEDPWIATTWSQGHLDPPAQVHRIRIIPGDETTTPTPGTAGVEPPTLEDLIPVPPSYRIQFEGGRTLLVVLEGEIPGARMELNGWRIRWEEFLQGLGLRPADPFRIRLRLDAVQGAALYRSFPSDPPDLLVVP